MTGTPRREMNITIQMVLTKLHGMFEIYEIEKYVEEFQLFRNAKLFVVGA